MVKLYFKMYHFWFFLIQYRFLDKKLDIKSFQCVSKILHWSWTFLDFPLGFFIARSHLWTILSFWRHIIRWFQCFGLDPMSVGTTFWEFLGINPVEKSRNVQVQLWIIHSWSSRLKHKHCGLFTHDHPSWNINIVDYSLMVIQAET